PNIYVKTRDGIRRVLARRKISKGEEITFDYCINNRDDTVRECACGAERCKRSISFNFFRLPLEIKCEYLPLLDDWFIRENEKLVKELETKCKKLGTR
ncbi:MAG: hypothetical protein JSV16_00005, partial [Candidatus Hydrogenedentota bacterium]